VTHDEELIGYILEGMARAIWSRAYIDWATNVDPPPEFPEGATWDDVIPYNADIRAGSLQAAEELLEGIEEANRGRSVLSAFREREQYFDPGGTQADRAYGFGGEIAQMSLGVLDPVPGVDLKLPTDFRVMLDDEGWDLSWDGGMTWARQPYPSENPAQQWPSSAVQSLLFDIHRYSERQAKRWAQDHGYKYGSVDTTVNYHRLRQFEPHHGQPCRTIEFGHGIKAIVCATHNPAGKQLGIEVLVLAQEPKTQTAIARMLKSFLTNPHIIFADNVKAAMADVEVHQFGLIIAEAVVLGALTGVDFFLHIQREYPGLVDRFVFFTDDETARDIHYKSLAKSGATAEALKLAVRARPHEMPAASSEMSPADVAASVNAVLPSIREQDGPSGLPMGRFGDKVFIAAAWRALERSPGFRAMTLSLFKRKLVEANRQGLVDLARMDARGDVDPEEVEESEVVDMGATFHMIRDRGARTRRPGFANLQEFSDAVGQIAATIRTEPGHQGKPKGRFGLTKVFIAAIWRAAQHDPRFAGMTRQEFNKKLLQAHRDSLIVMARADLVGAMDSAEVADSEIEDRRGPGSYAAQFHFVHDRQAKDWGE
jgi:hypothetical protein